MCAQKKTENSDDPGVPVAACNMASLASLVVLIPVAAGLSFRVWNPQGVHVHTVHTVFSSHFDAGCKTPGCGVNLPGEPDRCAVVGASNAAPTFTGEPYAYHIINRYFDSFFASAISSASSASSRNISYSYMTQPWLLSLYLDCERAGIRAWDGLGAQPPRREMLHCPNASSVSALISALKSGVISMHGFPHDGEASYYPSADIFESALSVAAALADKLGVPRPRAISQRDVPGWSRATIPLLAKHGILGLSFGAGTPPGKPDVPPLFLWRDSESGAEVVTTYETGYGGEATVFVLPNGVALAAVWDEDNRGPPDVPFVSRTIDSLRARFPTASVLTSTFDAFFVSAQPVKGLLPVVTAEIGDGWLYGVASDPLRNAQFRLAVRERDACVSSGECDPTSPSIRAFDRLLIKVPEHTWGVAQGWFLPDYSNWTNAAFDAARAQQPTGFVRNNSNHADYNTTVSSWVEQRLYVTDAPLLLAESHPKLASALNKGLAQLANVTEPGIPSTAEGFVRVDAAALPSTTLECSGLVLGFGGDGSISRFDDSDSGISWAAPEHPLGQYLYETYTNSEYNKFLNDFAMRLGDKGVWPAHTPPKSGCWYSLNATDDLGCGNFRKPNVTAAAHPLRRTVTPTVDELWWRRGHDGSCEVVIHARFRGRETSDAGAPERVITTIHAGRRKADFEVVAIAKRPTRLPEATFFGFRPATKAIRGGGRWSLRVLGSTTDPLDVLGTPGSTANDTVYGGSPHMRGVEEMAWIAAASGGKGNGSGEAASLRLSSLDVPIASIGAPSAFPTPRDRAPDPDRDGVHWNIHNNVWNTNYALWYPYLSADANIRSRFSLRVG
jgi:hypothetical protein